MDIRITVKGGGPQVAAALASASTAASVWYGAYQGGVDDGTAVQLGLTALTGGALTQALAALKRGGRR